MFFLNFSKAVPPGADLADLLKKNTGDYTMSFGHFLDLTPQSLGVFRLPLLGFSLAFLLGPLCNCYFRKRGSSARGNMALAAMMVVLLTCVHTAFVTFSPIISSRGLATAIEEVYQPGNLVVVRGDYSAASTLNFYTSIPLLLLHEPSSTLWYGSKFPDAPHVWETQASFDRLWQGPQRVFFWTDEDDPKELGATPRYLLARSGGKSILINRPLPAQPIAGK